jgi:hypothetical protein
VHACVLVMRPSTLQVLLAVPYFEHDLRATELDDLPLPSDGVTRALQACAVRRADTRAEAARGGCGTQCSVDLAAAPRRLNAAAGLIRLHVHICQERVM